MFTASVLKGIKDPELRRKLHLDDKGPDTESTLNWIRNNIGEFKPDEESGGKDHAQDDEKPLQQSDLLRKFYLSIAIQGLKKTYADASLLKPDQLPNVFPFNIDFHPGEIDKKHKTVIIVGGGVSGLVAGYELKRAGYEVNILEMSERFGGRVKTLGIKEGYDRGLHTDAGAMRLPLPPNKDRPIKNMIHYLTDYYATKKFNLNPVPFSNTDNNAFYNFYGDTTQIKDWKDSQFSLYWPGWNCKLIESGMADKVKNIGDYYKFTTEIVSNLLRNRLKKIPPEDLYQQACEWNIWTKNWCQFSFEAFVRSTVTGIKSQLECDYLKPQEVLEVDELEKYLPWPDEAISCHSVFTYTIGSEISLVAVLQEDMGKWWSSHMHSLEGGLSALPNAFAAKDKGNMEENITYNRTVTKVEYIWTSDKEKYVNVSGVFTSSGERFTVTGHSVILTPPLHVIRGIQIVNGIKIPEGIDPQTITKDSILKPFPREFQQAIQDITYSASTKIMLQYRQQFWNTGKDVDNDITGGFSKTNMPIGQLHYPTELEIIPVVKSDGDVDATEGQNLDGEQYVIQPAPVTEDQKGILMVYTWKAEALLWGALQKDMAIRLAVDQIDLIHPTINTKELFEVGYVQAWTSDPTTLGAFVKLRPREYLSVIYLMQNSWRNVYFAGEAISFANGWIQGALESGLRAAYQLYADDQVVIRKEECKC